MKTMILSLKGQVSLRGFRTQIHILHLNSFNFWSRWRLKGNKLLSKTISLKKQMAAMDFYVYQGDIRRISYLQHSPLWFIKTQSRWGETVVTQASCYHRVYVHLARIIEYATTRRWLPRNMQIYKWLYWFHKSKWADHALIMLRPKRRSESLKILKSR